MYFIAKLLKALHSDAGPWQLALGLALGMMMGLTPLLRLHNLFILFIVLFFRVNLTTFLLSFGIFSVLAFVFDPMMASVGESVLTNPSMESLWSALYATGFGQLSQFFHTLTMGSLVTSLILFPIVLFVGKYLIEQYREKFMAWIEKFRIVEIVKGSRIFQLYQRMDS